MKKLLGAMLLAGLTASVMANVVLERFDDPKMITGKIIPGSGAELDLTGGVERGALRAKGQKKNLQYIYEHSVYGKPGDKFAVALNYTSTAHVSNNFLIVVLYQTKDKGKTIGSKYFKLGLSMTRWTHRQFEITLPEGATKAQVLLRLANVPPTGEVKVDFFRIAPVVNNRAKGIDLETFDTTFDGWRFDQHLIFDHFMPGRGGKVVNEWREAKVGEAFFQAEGSGEPMQYALYIDNIRVNPTSNYVFEAWYKATKNFQYHANGMLIFFYKDKDGNALGQSRFHIRNTEEWKELLHTFTTPEKCEFVDIGLNMRKMKQDDKIKLDHLRFKNAGDKLYVKAETTSATAKMRVTAALTGNLKSSDIVSGKFTILSKDKKVVKEMNTAAGVTTLDVDLKTLPDGEYYIKPVITLKNGKVFDAPEEFFSVYNNPDWINDIGIQKPGMPAPKPWKDLAAAGRNTVENWSGKVFFNANGMVKNIYAGKGEVLTAPMQLTVNSAVPELKISNFAVQPSLATAKLSGKSGDLQLSGKVTSDYMGFTRYTLTVKANKDTALDEFKIALPVPDADFVSRTDGSWSNVGAMALKEIKKFTSKKFYDNIMVGTIDRGVSFFLSRLEPASKRKFDRDWLYVDKNLMSVNLVGEKIQLKAGESKVFDFAICAFPYRPAENNWRRLRFRAGKNSNLDLVWQTSSMFKYAGSLAVSNNDKYMKDYLSKKNGGYRLFYQCPPYILEQIPQWSFFRDQWIALPSRAYNFPPFGKLSKGNFRSKLWQDLYVQELVKMMKSNPWDGVYYDCFGTDLFTENGEHFNPVFELRDFQERIYNAQRIKDPASLTISHAGADQGNMMCAYSNVVLMGEQYRAEFYSNTYFTDFMSMDRFRFENASNIGPDRMILPQYRQEEKTESPKVSTHLSGMATLHCLMMYPNFIHSATELSIRDRMYAFGLNDADFIGYWQKEKPQIKTGSKDVYASYFDKKSGAFATVLNYSKQSNTVKLELPFNYKKAVIFDPVTQKETAYTGQAITLEPSMAKFITFTK
ncbi:MAG: hypothetical protein E7039_02145 [Lentisphaerae bacterium]|nr:hypothetical protein [Lentisphaerota bacterium]